METLFIHFDDLPIAAQKILEHTVELRIQGNGLLFGYELPLDPENPVWENSRGQKIPLAEMPYPYLVNALAKILRGECDFNQETHSFYVAAFCKEIASRNG